VACIAYGMFGVFANVAVGVGVLVGIGVGRADLQSRASLVTAVGSVVIVPTAVGVGTALFYDPLVCPKINRGIAEYLAARGHASLAALAAQ
jgi:energy-converting hydrogenase Eha subunit G